MTGHDEEGDTVQVTGSGPSALPQPMFLIKHGEVYYLTLAVWEYDLKDAKTDEQKEGYGIVHRHFEDHGGGVASAAITVPKGSPLAMTSTTKPSPPAKPKPDPQPRPAPPPKP